MSNFKCVSIIPIKNSKKYPWPEKRIILKQLMYKSLVIAKIYIDFGYHISSWEEWAAIKYYKTYDNLYGKFYLASFLWEKEKK